MVDVVIVNFCCCWMVGRKKGKGTGGKAKGKEKVVDASKSKPRLPCRFFRNGLCKNVSWKL